MEMIARNQSKSSASFSENLIRICPTVHRGEESPCHRFIHVGLPVRVRSIGMANPHNQILGSNYLIAS
jgi:hypothetical protein